MNFNTISPLTITELLEAIKSNQNNHFRFGAGYTDLILELQHQDENDLTIINLAKLNDSSLKNTSKTNSGIRVGALSTMANILDNNDLYVFPVLMEAVKSLASPQIRATATIGGNICTASPAGDVSCALVSLNALCEIINSDGNIRTVPIVDFFTGVKTTVLQKDEFLRSVLIPTNSNGVEPVSGFIKIGNRNSMEIALVSLAFHIIHDDQGIINSAGISIGSVAKTIMFAETAIAFLIGKNINQLSEDDKNQFADLILNYANPISDIRASAWYRKQVLWNISKSIF